MVKHCPNDCSRFDAKREIIQEAYPCNIIKERIEAFSEFRMPRPQHLQEEAALAVRIILVSFALEESHDMKQVFMYRLHPSENNLGQEVKLQNPRPKAQ